MKLPHQTHGPVSLTRIDYSKSLSEETYAFTAVISIEVNGSMLEAGVRNDGRGGENCVNIQPVYEAVEAYAKTLPPMSLDGQSYPMDCDSLISEMVGNAILVTEFKRALARRTLILREGKILSCKGKPTDLLRASILQRGPAVVLNDLPFPEAFKLFTSA